MIDVSAADQLLNFNARIADAERAKAQLQGAVAIHNVLCERRLAYLADEVGMGKTYVALGAVALFRHFDPNFRVLAIAPRQNIQRKWMKEMGNFVTHNVRFPDLRVKAVDGQPTRECIACENLLQLVHETSLNPNRDFFARLTSFSLPVGAVAGAVNADDARRLREELTRHFPWIDPGVFDLRDKRTFKDNIARAICCALTRAEAAAAIGHGRTWLHHFITDHYHQMPENVRPDRRRASGRIPAAFPDWFIRVGQFLPRATHPTTQVAPGIESAPEIRGENRAEAA